MARSRLNYITPGKLAQYIHTMSGVTDNDQAASFITDAERIVDAYVGPAPRFYTDQTGDTSAVIASGTSASVVTADVFGDRRPNYWAKGGHYLHVLDVPGSPSSALIGESRLIVASTSGQVTLVSGFLTDVPSGSTFWLHQESAFPRVWDTDNFGTPRLPDVLENAVALQVEYGILYGSEAFGLGDSGVATDEGASVQSRTYASGYSESRQPGQERGLARWTAPRARALLRSIMSNAGRLRGLRSGTARGVH